jgi:hypothetical protein
MEQLHALRIMNCSSGSRLKISLPQNAFKCTTLVSSRLQALGKGQGPCAYVVIWSWSLGYRSGLTHWGITKSGCGIESLMSSVHDLASIEPTMYHLRHIKIRWTDDACYGRFSSVRPLKMCICSTTKVIQP